jgi:uncharacterized membrane protein
MDYDFKDEVEKIIEKEETDTRPTFSERAADVVSEFGGSWAFIIFFLLFFGGWIAFNVVVFAFDEYPFILLNLILSCIAVFQAPFILMTQNRLSDIDRKRAENDYKVDLNNQIEIELIHKKIDEILLKLNNNPD